jgi:putative hemolysin
MPDPLPATAALASSPLPAVDDLQALAWLACALVGAAFFATMRLALQHSLPERVLARTRSDARRSALRPLLERVGELASSARLLELLCDLVFASLLVGWLAGDAPLEGWTVVRALILSVPILLLATEALPAVVARGWGDSLLIAALRPFHVLQLPISAVVVVLEGARRALMRVFGLQESFGDTRKIVEGLREVIEDSELEGDLDETEREIIENVMEFRDVDAAAIMTPRTEIHGIEISSDLVAAASRTSESGHSRIPVYEGSLDTILGTISARDLVNVAASEGLRQSPLELREILRPAYFVPETKPVSEILTEFRREKVKMAIVLDEYGGTAGLVTLGDVITEIVGDIHDEFDEDAPHSVQRLDDGSAEVDASLHVSDVNEELDLEIPDGEDFETLAGFVLSELGHFPKQGEVFQHDGVEYRVIEASDRRVLRVSIRPVEGAVA